MMHTGRDKGRPAASRSTRTVTAVVYSLALVRAFGGSEGGCTLSLATSYAQMAPLAEYLDTDPVPRWL